MSPGKRCSSSSQREILFTSTPRRSDRMSPASRNALKCCDRVDFGIVRSLICASTVQFCGHSEKAMLAKMAVRAGSDSAWKMPSRRYRVERRVKDRLHDFFHIGLLKDHSIVPNYGTLELTRAAAKPASEFNRNEQTFRKSSNRDRRLEGHRRRGRQVAGGQRRERRRQLRSSKEGADKVVEAIKAAGGKAVAVKGDVSRRPTPAPSSTRRSRPLAVSTSWSTMPASTR